jgi:hypothetical protein
MKALGTKVCIEGGSEKKIELRFGEVEMFGNVEVSLN